MLLMTKSGCKPCESKKNLSNTNLYFSIDSATEEGGRPNSEQYLVSNEPRSVLLTLAHIC